MEVAAESSGLDLGEPKGSLGAPLFHGSVEVFQHRQVSSGCFLLMIHAPELVRYASPGQFVMLRCTDSMDPLLSRAFSFCHINREKGTFSLLYKVYGKATLWLSRKKEGETVEVLGPLGRGFSVPPQAEEIVLVAGGVGVAGLVALGEDLALHGRSPYLLLGLSAKDGFMMVSEISSFISKERIFTSTIDGSLGERGDVVMLVRRFLQAHAPGTYSRPFLAVCGPKGMLRPVWEVAREYDLSAQFSVEEPMACGIGACKGCVIRVRKSPAVPSFQGAAVSRGTELPPEFRYALSCQEGPVFDATELVFS